MFPDEPDSTEHEDRSQEWEPEPLELPLAIPGRRHGDGDERDVPLAERRVVVIDLV